VPITILPPHTARPIGARWCAALGLPLILLLAGCSSSLYGWQVRTNSSPPAPSFNQTVLAQEPVAIFGALAQPGLLGTEVGMDTILAQVLSKVAPQIKVIPTLTMFSLINGKGLSHEYTRMKIDALLSNILDRESLQKLGKAIGARYVFQPRLTAFTQVMTERWKFKFPGVDLRLSETRSSMMRVSLQLWDTETGALHWAALAETTLQSEALSESPVYFDDAARVTLGSLIADLLNRKTASTYDPLNKLIDQLIQRPNGKNSENGEPLPAAPASDSRSAP
jgi:hypothetical protein